MEGPQVAPSPLGHLWEGQIDFPVLGGVAGSQGRKAGEGSRVRVV